MTTDETDAEIERIEEEFYIEAERVNLRFAELGYDCRFRVKLIPADQFNQELRIAFERDKENFAKLMRKRFHIVPTTGGHS